MSHQAAIEELIGAVDASRLVEPGTRGVALISGGADSSVLAAALAHSCRRPPVALHLDYGLREGSAADAEACAALCKRLGLELVVRRPRPEGGNTQAWAREARYRAAEELRAERELDWIATGHTRTDVAETVIYRLAASPGGRALLGLAPRRGRIVRPLIGLSRDRVRELARALALPFRDDPTNAEPLYARNRIRADVLPVMRDLSPAAEENIAATQAELRSDHELLDRLAADALAREERDGGIPAAALAAMDAPIARRVLRLLAERAAGRQVALGAARAAEVLRVASRPEGGTIELGGGIEARAEHDLVLVEAPAASGQPRPAELSIGGSCTFDGWVLRAEACEPRRGGRGVVLDRDSLSTPLTVRGWREGDRMRPLGLGGAKSLQDLFTDRRVPRSRRRRLPVVVSGDEIAWVAGVEIGESFKLSESSAAGVRLTAEPARN